MPAPDRNYFSYDGAQVDDSNRVFDPLGDDYKKWGIKQPDGSYAVNWDDTLKFHRRVRCVFTDMTIVQAGLEDGVDINQDCDGNTFKRFYVTCGKQGLTFKGGCRNNLLEDWVFMVKGESSYTVVNDDGTTTVYKVPFHEGKYVEAEFGNWSSRSMSRCTGNVAQRWTRNDGNPVRYAGRFGCIPKFDGGNVKHVIWLSVGITAYYWGKWVLVKLGLVSA